MQDRMIIRQAADLLGIHRQTVYQAIRAGRLPSEIQRERATRKHAPPNEPVDPLNFPWSAFTRLRASWRRGRAMSIEGSLR
jgi:hypothetical protein